MSNFTIEDGGSVRNSQLRPVSTRFDGCHVRINDTFIDHQFFDLQLLKSRKYAMLTGAVIVVFA